MLTKMYGLKTVLRNFKLALGFRVNFSKTKIVGVRMNMTLIQNFSNILNCKYMERPFKYLRVQIGGIKGENSFGNLWLLKLKASCLVEKVNYYLLLDNYVS